MENVDIELLINLVQIKPYLYNKYDKFYKDLTQKENAWKEIAEALNITPVLCEKVWKNTKDKYLRERKKLKSVASGSGSKEYTWPWYDDMSFLDGVISERRRTVSNLKPQQKFLQEVLPDDINIIETDSTETFINSSCSEEDLETPAQDLEHLIEFEFPNTGNINISRPLTETLRKATPSKKSSDVIDLQILNTINSLSSSKNEESVFGGLVANELAKIKDFKKRKAMKRKIMDIIYLDDISD